MTEICRFRFPTDTDTGVIESQFTLAIVAAECAFGQPRVRMNVAYCISEDKLQVAIDVSTDIGQHIAQVFTGLMIRQLGEDNFIVNRLNE